VSPLVAGGKQPYEVVVAARRPGTESPAAGLKLPDGLVLYSVPSGLHSHKPPLEEVLGAVAAGAGRELVAGLAKLEVFGRSLLPGWTTLGLQPCLLNTRPADH
jgi:N6-adenosine-specific RNA methylase IME4